jgi:hypothetical protein
MTTSSDDGSSAMSSAAGASALSGGDRASAASRLPLAMDLYGLAILDLDPPVAIETMPRAWPAQHRAMLHDLVSGIGYGLDQVSSAWVAAFAEVGCLPVRLRVDVDDTADGAALTVAAAYRRPHSSGVGEVAEVVLGARPVVVGEIGLESTERLKCLLADVLADALRGIGVSTEAALGLANAIKQAPPTVAVHATQPLQAAPVLPSPVSLDQAPVSTAERRLAEQLHALKLPTGSFHGIAARDIESQQIAPAALGLLQDALAGYPLGEILTTGLTQLERASVQHKSRRRGLHEAVGATPLRYDPIRRAQENEARGMRLRRAITTILEVALRSSPSGAGSLDWTAWAELLGSADVYVASTFRSERLHHQLSPLAVTITQSYEVELHTEPTADDGSSAGSAIPAAAARTYQLDIDAFTRARAAEGLPSAYDDDLSVPEPADGVAGADVSADPFAGMEGIRNAMREAYGADVVDLMAALACLATWPVTSSEPVALVTLADAVRYCLDHSTAFNEEAHARATLELLLLRPAMLQAGIWRPWEARRRSARLETRPLLALSDDELYVLPHWCEGSASIYSRYLLQGLLPWPDPEINPTVRRALADYRDVQNRRLEDEVANDLTATGYRVRKRVRPEDARSIGLATLHGEIDVLAARPSSNLLWVIEVKDPAEVFTTSEIRRALDRFFDEDEWIDKLVRKTADVTSDPAGVAAALGLKRDTPWEVRPLVVTRRVVPAAFVTSPVPIIALRDLRIHLG